MNKWLTAIIMIASAATCSAAEMKDDGSINIYFARHGKTLLNTFDRVQGWADSPLTEDGIRVARYLGEGLKEVKFDRFYSSDAGRQRETLAVILKQAGIADYHPIELPGLREAFFGSFEGGFNKDMAAADPQGMAENYQQVKSRTQAALHTIVENAESQGDKNILAISSGTSMQIMISDLTDDTAKNKPLANAAVVKIVYKNGIYSVPEIGTMKYVEAGKQALNNNN